eukprot:255517_1
MGTTHSKATQPTTPTHAVIRDITTNGKLLWRAIFIHIENEARQRNIHLPSDVITLCINHVSFIMSDTILTVKEEMELFDHLQSKVRLKRSMKMMYCQLLYEHQFITPFDMKRFVKTLENKSDQLIIFWTEFNHIISLFINQRIRQRNVNCKMFALLLRSQFGNHCQCPKELEFTTPHFIWNVERDVSPGIVFGGLGLYESTEYKQCIELSMYSPDIANIDGNEVFGGITYTKGRQHLHVQLKRIQIYQMFC